MSAVGTLPPSKWAEVEGHRVHYVEAGQAGPPIVLVHGLPTHAALWRRVMPRLALQARTVAVDLLGFGRSDKPLDIDYDIDTQARHLAGVLEGAAIRRPLIVAMDLGLMVALHHALNREVEISGVVMFEGWFLPMREAWPRLPLAARVNMRLLRNRWLAERFIARNEAAVERFLRLGTERPMSASEIEIYSKPLADRALRRKLWVDGVGPGSFGPAARQAGDTIDIIDRYAARLARSPIPKLLLHATPGMVVNAKIIEQAKASIHGLKVVHLGAGKHFLPEDQPMELSAAVAEFHASLQV